MLPSRALAVLRIVLLAVVFTGACRGNETVNEDASHRVAVDVAAAQIGDLRDVVSASGTIVPSRAGDLTIHAPEPAEIADLPKQPDETVDLGDVLVRFDIPSLTQERAAAELQLIEASSRLERTQAELTRQTSLFERGITARNTYDIARLDHAAAETALAAAKSRLEILQASDDRSIVRAPFAGVVTAVWHNVGDAVRPDVTDPILRVIDPTRVQAIVQIPFAQLARVVTGQSATVRTILGDVTEAATVAAVSQDHIPGAPTGEVRLAFDNPVSLPLDTPVSVELVLDRRSGVLFVPTQAVGRDDFGTFVLIAGDDGLAHRRDVRTGLTTPQFTQIAEGLEMDEPVILLTEYDEITDQTPIVIAR